MHARVHGRRVLLQVLLTWPPLGCCKIRDASARLVLSIELGKEEGFTSEDAMWRTESLVYNYLCKLGQMTVWLSALHCHPSSGRVRN